MVALGGSLVFGCKKNSSGLPLILPVMPVSVLCNGNGTDSWLPLKTGNEWHYKNHVNHSRLQTITVLDQETRSGHIYFKVEINLAGRITEQFIREATNGDIHQYNVILGKDELYIPSEPISGQIIQASGSQTTRQVGSLTDTITTAKCNYPNVLRIDLFSNGTLTGSEFYHRGIGQVYNSTNYWDLVSVTLH